MHDQVNAIFEACATIILMFHIRALRIEKVAIGFSIVPIIFYSLWGAWNLIYYPILGQMLSFYAGIGVFAVNTGYVAMVVYYRRFPGGR